MRLPRQDFSCRTSPAATPSAMTMYQGSDKAVERARRGRATSGTTHVRARSTEHRWGDMSQRSSLIELRLNGRCDHTAARMV